MIEFTVYGTPGPQGSKRFVGLSKAGRGVMIESSAKVKPWRQAVKWAAREALEALEEDAVTGAVYLDIIFTLKRPKSAPKTRKWADRKPDLSKLVRATEDSLTDAGVYEDDARVVSLIASKRYVGDPGALDSPGAQIRIKEAA